MIKKIEWWHHTRPFLNDEPDDDPDVQYCPLRDGMCIDRCMFYMMPGTDIDEPCMLVEYVLTNLYGQREG